MTEKTDKPRNLEHGALWLTAVCCTVLCIALYSYGLLAMQPWLNASIGDDGQFKGTDVIAVGGNYSLQLQFPDSETSMVERLFGRPDCRTVTNNSPCGAQGYFKWQFIMRFAPGDTVVKGESDIRQVATGQPQDGMITIELAEMSLPAGFVTYEFDFGRISKILSELPHQIMLVPGDGSASQAQSSLAHYAIILAKDPLGMELLCGALWAGWFGSRWRQKKGKVTAT